MNLRVAPHGHSWLSYLKGLSYFGVFFGAVGPPIGAVFSPGVVLFPVAMMLAYYASGVAAFIAGCLVGVVTSFARTLPTLYVSAAIIGAVSGASVVTFVDPVTDGFRVICALSGAMAGMACMRLSRWMRLAPGNPMWLYESSK